MASTRLVQLLVLLLVFDQPSFAHTQLGIPRRTGGRKMLVNQFPDQGTKENNMSFENIPKISGNDELPEKHHLNVQVGTLQHKGNEVEKLMWKDYSGRARPRRKPPIHNYNPTTKH